MPHDHGPVLQYDAKRLLTVGALAGQDAVIQPTKIDASRDQGFRLIWVKLAGFFRAKTAAEGPITLGLCCNLEAAQLEDILNDDVQGRSDVTKTGPGSWYVPLTQIGLDAVEGDIWGQSLSNTQQVSIWKKIPVNWTIPEGQFFGVYMFNDTTGALTTGMLVELSLQYFGVWLRD